MQVAARLQIPEQPAGGRYKVHGGGHGAFLGLAFEKHSNNIVTHLLCFSSHHSFRCAPLVINVFLATLMRALLLVPGKAAHARCLLFLMLVALLHKLLIAFCSLTSP